MALLEVEDLQIQFTAGTRIVRAVSGLSFQLETGRTLGLVGESGCGKSVTAFSLMHLLPPPPGCEVRGKVRFSGRDLFSLASHEWEKIRGKEMGMIFQEPMTALNPVYSIGTQVAESLWLHEPGITREKAWKVAAEMLRKVGIGEAERRMGSYPHELSGGMRQRVLIAMALACHPRLLIADEPTTALDVTVQAQILDLVRSLKAELGMAVLSISHDLGVINAIADEVLVMYAGQAVEQATSERLFAEPLHPYTRGLIDSLPPPLEAGRRFSRLTGIGGSVPDPAALPAGCRFAERCALVQPGCREAVPPLEEKRPGHFARCFEVEARP